MIISPIPSPENFASQFANYYVNFASLTMLIYDHVVTIDKEVERIWTLPWRLPKILFMINRYITPPLLLLDFTVQVFYSLRSPGFCHIYVFWQALPPRIALLCAELIIIIRVWAIYGNSKAILCFLVALFICELGALTAFVTLGVKATIVVPSGPMPGCFLDPAIGNNLDQYATATWIVPVVFEVIIVALTLYKIFPWSSPNLILRLLARDSAVYFIFSFALSIANAVIDKTPVPVPSGLLLGPSSAMASLAVSRMMLNIRKLSVDEETQLTLDDLTFRHRTTSHDHI